MSPSPVKYTVRITPRAYKSLKAVFDYIATSSPDNAADFIGDMLKAMYGLDILPHRYGPSAGLSRATGREVRKMPFGNYMIDYRIVESTRTVLILYVWHGARQRRRGR